MFADFSSSISREIRMLSGRDTGAGSASSSCWSFGRPMESSSSTCRSACSRFNIDWVNCMSAFGVEKRSGDETWKSEGERMESSSLPSFSPKMRRLTFEANEKERDILGKMFSI